MNFEKMHIITICLLIIDIILINTTVTKINKTQKKQLKDYDDLKESIRRKDVLDGVCKHLSQKYDEGKTISLINKIIQIHECKKCAVLTKPEDRKKCKICETKSEMCYAKDKQYIIDRLKIVQGDERNSIVGEQ